MRLERIFTHRLLGVLRLAIPVVVLALIAIPAWNYVSRRAVKLPAISSKKLPKDLQVRTEGFTFSQTKGGRKLFTIRAETNLGFKDNKNTLEDVDVTIFGETENDPPKRVRSKFCTYDQQTNDFNFNGNVEAQLDENTILRSEELVYNNGSRTVVSPAKASVEKAGSMNASADSLEYGIDSGLLKLTGNVAVATADHLSLNAAAAVFQQKENWATADGDVLIKSASGWIRGASAKADLQPGTYQPKSVVVDGGVTAQRDSEGGSAWNVKAGRMEADMSPQGNPEHVRARDKAEVERVIGGVKQTMTGGEMDATLDASGTVTLVEARQNARMVFGSDRMLKANQIWSNSQGSIATKDESVLQFGDSTIEGRQFTIQQGDIVTFSTPEHADLQSGARRTSADRTDGRFDSRTNSLIELVQSGNFHFTEGAREGRAQNARFENGGSVVTLEGSPVVTDSQMRVEAGQIRLDQAQSSFLAVKNVKTVTRNSGEPVLVTANRAEGGAENMLYTGNVQLWRGTAYIKAERLEASSRNNSLHGEGHVQSSIDTIRATSDKLDYDDGSRMAHYTGGVRAQKQDMILETRDMTARLGDKDVDQIVSTGGVVVTQGTRRGTGDQAVYESSTSSVTLTGKSAEVVDKQQGTVRGTRLVMKTTGETLVVEGETGGRSITKHTVTK